MHPLHDYIARQISDRLKDRRIVVMYDPRKELPTFFEEACEGAGDAGLMRTGTFGSRKASVCSFQGSFLEVRSAVEPLTGGEDVERRRRLRARRDEGRDNVAAARNRKGRRLLPGSRAQADRP